MMLQMDINYLSLLSSEWRDTEVIHAEVLPSSWSKVLCFTVECAHQLSEVLLLEKSQGGGTIWGLPSWR